MIEFKTDKGEFVVDEVDLSEVAMYKFFDNPRTFRYGVSLKPLFLLSEAKEEDAKLIMDELRSEEYKYTDMVEQLQSLLTSKGIDINNGNWYLFKKI